MIVSNTPAIVTNAFPSEQRGAGLGVIGAVVSVGLMLGPPLGGMIINFLGWHYIFLVNIPVGIVAILMTLKILPEYRANSGTGLFNLLDSLLWIGGVTALVFAFRVSGGFSTIAGEMGLYFVTCAVLLGVFYVRQLRSNAPLLKPGFFRNDIILLASVAGFFTYMTMISLTFMFPYLLQNTFRLSPFDTGLVLVVIPATTAVVSPLSGHLSDRFGQRPIASLGSILFTCAILSMFLVNQSSPVGQIVISLALFGIGLGMFGSPNNSAIMGSVDIRDRGSAGGIVATVRNLGMVSGLGIISLLYNAGLKANTGSGSLAYLMAFRGALPVIVGLSAMSLIFSGLRKSVS